MARAIKTNEKQRTKDRGNKGQGRRVLQTEKARESEQKKEPKKDLEQSRLN